MPAKAALGFSSFEYFWLTVLGLSCAALISLGGLLKGALALLLGLFIAQVSMDPCRDSALYGMFAVSEILRAGHCAMAEVPQMNLKNPFKGTLAALWKYRKNQMRSSVIGSLLGALPGVGGDLAAWITYSLAKRTSREPEKFGKGHPEGLVEAGATNNAALSAFWIPAMVFGIPGDAVVVSASAWNCHFLRL